MLSTALLLVTVHARWPSADQIVNNETNETEFEVYVLPTPPPTKPKSQVNVAVPITSAVASAPDPSALKAAMQASLAAQGQTVNLNDIQTVVEYVVAQEFTFGAGVTVTEAVAKRSVGVTFSVSAENVEVTIVVSRRLQGTNTLGRRLAGTTVNAAIKVNDPTKADSIKTQGADTSAISQQLASNYATEHQALTGTAIPVPSVSAAAPALEMVISYEISSQTGTAVEAPSTTNLQTAFQNQGGSLAAVSSSISVATPAPTSAPTAAPTPLPLGQTFAPTALPTKAPTGTPTKTPTKTPTGMPTKTPTNTPVTAPPSLAPTVATTTPAPAPEGISESAAFSLQFSFGVNRVPVVCTVTAAALVMAVAP